VIRTTELIAAVIALLLLSSKVHRVDVPIYRLIETIHKLHWQTTITETASIRPKLVHKCVRFCVRISAHVRACSM
jgi:hypothetical protein